MRRELYVVAQVERDAKNRFFARMLYGFTHEKGVLCSPATIDDSRMLDVLIGMTDSALSDFPCGNYQGSTIVVYNPNSDKYYNGSYAEYKKPDKIITGTKSADKLKDVNYLIRMISHTVTEKKMGEFQVEYEGKKMSAEEFYEFQKGL